MKHSNAERIWILLRILRMLFRDPGPFLDGAIDAHDLTLSDLEERVSWFESRKRTPPPPPIYG